jgi:transposase
VAGRELERRFEQLEKQLAQLKRRDLWQRGDLAELRKENGRLRRQLKRVTTLEQQLEQAQASVRQLTKENDRLRVRERELEMRLGQDSQTSSRPPSSDPLWEREARRKERNERKGKKRKKKRGAKKGHRGTHRQMVKSSEVDQVEAHQPLICRSCSASLSEAPARLAWRHQVVELMDVEARLIEHRGYEVCCGACGEVERTRRPSWLVCTGAFGPRLRALMALLVTSYRLSRRQVQRLLRQVWGVAISLGAVSANEAKMSVPLLPIYEDAHAQAQRSARAHADETSWLSNDSLAWLWTLVTPEHVIYRIDRRRTKEAAKRMIGSFVGLLTTDRFSGYGFYDPDKRQFCWSHLDRDVAHLVKTVPEEAALLKKMKGLIGQMFGRHQRIRDGTVPWRRGWHRKLRGHFDKCLRQGLDSKHKPVRRLCRSLLKNPDALWRFASFADGEPTNNAAERALRHAVIWRRISQGSRSERGARFVERMLTALETLRVQGRDAWTFLARVMHTHVRGTELPSLHPGSLIG